MSKKKIKRYFLKNNKKLENNRKIVGIIVFSITIGLFFLFTARLSYIVLVGKIGEESLSEKTTALYRGSEVVKAKRGTIYDRNGIPIAEDTSSYDARVILSKTYVTGNQKLYAQEKDFDKLLTILANNIEGFDKEKNIEILKNALKVNPDTWQVPLGQAKNLSTKQMLTIQEELKKQNLKGIDFDKTQSRMYRNGEFASHFIGYASLQKTKSGTDELVGQMGIEAAYDKMLRGEDGKIYYQKDNYQNPLPGTVSEQKVAKDGKDIYTTLDSRVQLYLEKYMKDAYQKADAKWMTAMLVKADTGEVIAMNQEPSFNPETMEGTNAPNFNWANVLTEETYEPGSTMKTMMVSSALTEGVFDPNESYQGGRINVAGTFIDDWDHGKRGTLTMRQALSWSSNKGMVLLQEKMPDAWQQYIRKFGFGRSTFSGLPNEKTGILPSKNIVDRAMSAFGQGIAVTNFQMMQAFTAVANNGKMLKPQVISKVVNPDTKEAQITEPEIVGHPITAEAAQKTREYMRDTTESKDYGTSYGLYNIPGNLVSVKTGTAQVVEKGVYLKGPTDYIYSAVTMVPTEKPKYILYITMKQPKVYDYKVIADITNAVIKRALDLEDVPTSDKTADDSSLSKDKVTVANYQNQSIKKAGEEAQKSNLDPIILGDGLRVKTQSLKEGTKVLSGEKLFLLTNADVISMPDIHGWSKSDIMDLAKLLKLDVKFEGQGFAVEQSIDPYVDISGKSLKVNLKEN